MCSETGSTASVLNATSTIVTTLATGEATAPTPSGSGNRIVVFASAGGLSLLLVIVGLLFCLKRTRTMHRCLNEDMERRLGAFENQRVAEQTRRGITLSSASGTILGSDWGSWRTEDMKSFQKLGRSTKARDRRSFKHGWWSFSPEQGEKHGIPLQTADINSPSALPHLSAIEDIPTFAPPTSSVGQGSRHDSSHATILDPDSSQPQPRSLVGKETTIREGSRSGDRQNRTTPVVAFDKECLIQSRTALPNKSHRHKSHQRKPAIVGNISPFPPGTSDSLVRASAQCRPISVINEEPGVPLQKTSQPVRVHTPSATRPPRGFIHVRNTSAISTFSDDSEDTYVTGHRSTSSKASSRSHWPFDINRPAIDYGGLTPRPKFKQSTSELDLSVSTGHESIDLHADAIADVNHALIEKEDEGSKEATSVIQISAKGEKPKNQIFPKAKHRVPAKATPPDPTLNPPLSAPITYGNIDEPHFSLVPATNHHASLPPTTPSSSIVSSTRSSNGNPFQWDPPPTTISGLPLSTSSVEDIAFNQQHARPSAGTKPVLASRAGGEAHALDPMSNRTDRSHIKCKSSSGRTKVSTRAPRDLRVLVPPPNLPYHLSTPRSPISAVPARRGHVPQIEPDVDEVVVLEVEELPQNQRPILTIHERDPPPSPYHAQNPPCSPKSVSLPTYPRTDILSRSTRNQYRQSHGKDENTYNIQNALPSRILPPKNRKKLIGPTDRFTVLSDNFLRQVSRESDYDSFVNLRSKVFLLERMPVSPSSTPPWHANADAAGIVSLVELGTRKIDHEASVDPTAARKAMDLGSIGGFPLPPAETKTCKGNKVRSQKTCLTDGRLRATSFLELKNSCQPQASNTASNRTSRASTITSVPGRAAGPNPSSHTGTTIAETNKSHILPTPSTTMGGASMASTVTSLANRGGFGCHYEPRENLVPPTPSTIPSFNGTSMASNVSSTTFGYGYEYAKQSPLSPTFDYRNSPLPPTPSRAYARRMSTASGVTFSSFHGGFRRADLESKDVLLPPPKTLKSATFPTHARKNSGVSMMSTSSRGFGPGPSLSLLEKWEAEGRSYITARKDQDIATFSWAKGRRERSPTSKKIYHESFVSSSATLKKTGRNAKTSLLGRGEWEGENEYEIAESLHDHTPLPSQSVNQNSMGMMKMFTPSEKDLILAEKEKKKAPPSENGSNTGRKVTPRRKKRAASVKSVGSSRSGGESKGWFGGAVPEALNWADVERCTTGADEE